MNIIVNNISLVFFGIIAFVLGYSINLDADTLKPSGIRLKLRNDIAINYTQPESHLRLAHYHYDSGNKIQAFYIAEFARGVFGDEKFGPAFDKIASIKLYESQKFESEEQYRNYCRSHPVSFEAYAMNLSQKLEEANTGEEQKNNEQLIETALSKFPQHYLLKALVAKYYLKTIKNKEKALPFYIDLYFHNPHYYDGEYAEFRIKQITSALKLSWYESRKSLKTSLKQVVTEERNPRVLDVIIHKAREKWEPSMLQVMLKMLENDDPSVQSSALHTILNRQGALTDVGEIRKMIKSDDYVKRAIASFLVVKCLGNEEYHLLKDNLDSGVELIQLDTIQALSMMGGEKGREYLKNNKPSKANEKMMAYWIAQTHAKDKAANK